MGLFDEVGRLTQGGRQQQPDPESAPSPRTANLPDLPSVLRLRNFENKQRKMGTLRRMLSGFFAGGAERLGVTTVRQELMQDATLEMQQQRVQFDERNVRVNEENALRLAQKDKEGSELNQPLNFSPEAMQELGFSPLLSKELQKYGLRKRDLPTLLLGKERIEAAVAAQRAKTEESRAAREDQQRFSADQQRERLDFQAQMQRNQQSFMAWMQKQRQSDKPASIGENAALGYAARMISADRSMRQTEDEIAGGGLLRQAQSEYAPQFLRSQSQQSYRAAADDYMRAGLRKESGAAIGVQEQAGEEALRIVKPGDSPATVAQKRAQRRIHILSLLRGAGRAATAENLAEIIGPEAATEFFKSPLVGQPSPPTPGAKLVK